MPLQVVGTWRGLAADLSFCCTQMHYGRQVLFILPLGSRCELLSFQLLRPSFLSLRCWKPIKVLPPSLTSKYRSISDRFFCVCPSLATFFPTFQALPLSNTDFILSRSIASDILIYCSTSLVHFSLYAFLCVLVQTIQKEVKSWVADAGVSSAGPFPSRSFIGWVPQSTILYLPVPDQRVRWSVMVVQISRDHPFEVEWKYFQKSGLLLEKSGPQVVHEKIREECQCPKQNLKDGCFPLCSLIHHFEIRKAASNMCLECTRWHWQRENIRETKIQFAGNNFVNIETPKIKLEFSEGQGEKVLKCQQNWEMLSKHLTSSANTRIASPVKFN